VKRGRALGRPRTHPAVETKFGLWLSGFMKDLDLKVPVIAAVVEQDDSQVYRWLNEGQEPGNPTAVKALLLAKLGGAPAIAAAIAARSWQAALAPCLLGSPLEGTLGQLALAAGNESDERWRELAEDRKADARDTLRRFAAVATVIASTFPSPIAERLNAKLAEEIHSYLDQAF
jgi:hypothetical protein